MNFLEKAWAEREEQKYKEIFGDLGEGIYPLDAEVFTQQYKQENIDPRWLHYGVFMSPPNNSRDSWAYISSGMSNPWEKEEKDEYSGLGVEFILETKQKSAWAIEVIRSLIAYNILLSVGRFGDLPMLDYGHRIPMNLAPSISHIMMVSPSHYPDHIDLMSGRVDFLHAIGITEEEYSFAKEHSSSELNEKLKEDGIYPLTARNRQNPKA